MCLTSIKNIDDIYYPRNWDNFHNKTNSILVENRSIREFNVNLVFQRFQKNKKQKKICGGRDSNPGPCIYYSLSLPTELSSRGPK